MAKPATAPAKAGKGGVKKIDGYIKLQIPAGSANPSPPIGPALGQRGVNIMEFCKAFNAATEKLPGIDKGTPLPVVIAVYSDKSFTFQLKSPPASFLIKKAAGLTKGSSNAKKNKVGKLTKKQVADIVAVKVKNLTAASLEAGIRTIAGSARSMGIDIID